MMETVSRMAVPLFFALCLLMGGASNGGYLENLLLQIAGIALVVAALLSRPRAASWKIDPFAPWLALLWIIIVLLQFVPLPLSSWTALPGRAEIGEELSLLGVAPTPATITLGLHDSLSSLAWALPAVCVAVALSAQEQVDAKRLSTALVACTFLGLALGLVQFLGGDETSAYLYEITNRGLLVGVFANANHMATMLLVTLPFLSVLTRTAIDKRPGQGRELLLIWALLTGFVVIGIALVGSLTGYALAGPVIALSAVITFPHSGKLLKLALLPALIMGVAIVATTDEGGNIFADEASLSERGRQQIFATTTEAAINFWPVGTGLGTFPEVYDNFEEEDAVDTTYVNHAHNDYLEMMLEFGLPGLIGILAFLVWWLSRLRALWSSMGHQPSVQAAAIASGIILIHSAWDYPLRTAAIGAVFALCCVILSSGRATTPAQDVARGKATAS